MTNYKILLSCAIAAFGMCIAPHNISARMVYSNLIDLSNAARSENSALTNIPIGRMNAAADNDIEGISLGFVSADKENPLKIVRSTINAYFNHSNNHYGFLHDTVKFPLYNPKFKTINTIENKNTPSNEMKLNDSIPLNEKKSKQDTTKRGIDSLGIKGGSYQPSTGHRPYNGQPPQVNKHIPSVIKKELK